MSIKNIFLLVCMLFPSSVALLAAPQNTRNRAITFTYKTKNDSIIGTETKPIQNNTFKLEYTYQGYVVDTISTQHNINQAIAQSDSDTLQVTVIVMTEQEAQAMYLMPALWPILRDSLAKQSMNKEGTSEYGFQNLSENSYDILPLLLAGLALLVAIVAAVVLLLLYRRDKKQETERIINAIISNPQLTTWRDEVLSNIVDRTPQAPAKPNGEIRDLQRRISELEDKLRNGSLSSEEPKVSTPQGQQKRFLYADSIVNDLFLVVRENADRDSIFKLELTCDTHAIVTIYDDAKRKVLANSSYLDGCEKEIIGNQIVQIVRNGEAEKDSNGKWRVRSKLKVVLR